MIKILPVFLIIVLAGCSSSGTFNAPSELHAIGVYEGTYPDDDGQPWHAKCGQLGFLNCHQNMTQRKRELGGEVVVNISITDRPLVLAFSAYDKTKWIVKPEKGVTLEKVILSGYHPQSIEGIAEDTPIEVYTYEESPCPKCYQGSVYFYSYRSVPDKLTAIAGMSATTWQGEYKGKEFSILPDVTQPDTPENHK